MKDSWDAVSELLHEKERRAINRSPRMNQFDSPLPFVKDRRVLLVKLEVCEDCGWVKPSGSESKQCYRCLGKLVSKVIVKK